MKLQVTLKQLLHQKDMTQKELAELTGLKESIISDLANNRRGSINRTYIERIALALNLQDVGEILTFDESE